MRIFLTDSEREAFTAFRKRHAAGEDLFWALRNRVEARAASPGLYGPAAESHWWYCAAEYLTEAAMLFGLQPDERVRCWLRDVVLSIARRPA